MRELEFRQALRDEMSQVTRPLRLTETDLLDAARRASRRRRGVWASAGSAVAVAALAVGTVLTVTGDDQAGPSTGATSTVSSGPIDPQTKRSARLLDLLTAAVPPGWETPTDLTAPAGNKLREHEASQKEGWWEYVAVVPVAKDQRYGRLLALVSTPGNYLYPDAEGCELTTTVTDAPDCQEITVNDKTIGVITDPAGVHGPGSQVAVYRYPDGTVVFIEQDYAVFFSGEAQPLTEMPLTPQQLAELAADARLRLD